MRTRAEAAKFASDQFEQSDVEAIPNHFSELSIWSEDGGHKRVSDNGFKQTYHYGKCELRALLDYIFEAEPASEEEMVK